MLRDFTSLLLILACIISGVTAQSLLKYGIQRLGVLTLAWVDAWPLMAQCLQSPYIMAGIGCYILSFFAWFVTLSRMDVSLAYPLTSLGYLLTLLVGYLWLQETITPIRIIGVIVIIFGVFLVARS